MFKNKELQTLYNELIKRGSQSRTDALKVGLEIEELDLFDIARWLKTTTSADIQRVYANLAKGSRNHLRAFASGLARTGETYKPKHLDPAEFQKIATSPMERGRGG